jgi:hypothetical protein
MIEMDKSHKKETKENIIAWLLVLVSIGLVIAFFWVIFWISSINPCFPCQNCHTNGGLCWCPDGNFLNSTNPSCDTRWLKVNISIGKSEYCGDFITCVLKNSWNTSCPSCINKSSLWNPSTGGGWNPPNPPSGSGAGGSDSCQQPVDCFQNSTLKGCIKDKDGCNWCCESGGWTACTLLLCYTSPNSNYTIPS